jgi:riboflavin kinase/FMN adenylyltransferase
VKVYRNWASVRDPRRPVALAAGFFDGVHRGHQRVIARTVAAAKARGGRAWVLTFDTHPLRVLNPAAAPRLLTSLPHKLRMLNRLGIDACLALPFTRGLARLKPKAFIETLSRHIPTLSEVLVGGNWRFGSHGRGGPELLTRLGRPLGFRTTVVPPVRHGGLPVSSTRIRDAVTAGRLAESAVMLGRPFSAWGTVVPGEHRGRGIGYPTANLDTHNEVLPPEGVYAVHAVLDNRTVCLDGVLNLGVRPTFHPRATAAPVLEMHLLDFKQTLYGRDIEVFFVARLRDERPFARTAELARQIALDIDRARAMLRRGRARKIVKESLYTSCGPVYSPPRKKKEV